MVVNSETFEKNALTLLKKFPDAKRILQKADGKKDYQKIAEELNINSKTTSPTLSLAKDLGFAEKIKPGIYKKITSTMKYIPNRKQEIKGISIENMVNKLSKRRIKKIQVDEIQYSFNFRSKVEKMAEAYKWLFVTENTLRELIRTVFASEKNWWENRVPDGVKQKVEEAKLSSPYDDAKRKDELDYTHLGQLKEIITSKKNWGLFLPHLKKRDISTFKVDTERIIPSRNAIGHCIPLAGEDYKYTEMRFKTILKMLK